MLNGGTLLRMGAGKDLLIKQEIRSNFSFMINTYLRALPSLLYLPLGPGNLFPEGGHSPYMLKEEDVRCACADRPYLQQLQVLPLAYSLVSMEKHFSDNGS